MTKSNSSAAMEAAGTSSVADVLAVEPVIRRVITSRLSNRDDVDDLVHDCLERLLTARTRLAPETVLPFGIVTAQNLVVSQARVAARRRRGAQRLVDRDDPDRPDDAVVASEARLAMIAALDRLTPQERADVLAYQDRRARPAEGGSESAAALRVRMARTRAKLRLEYLLAFRRVTLPSPLCGRVLLAVSGGDTRRQRALGAGEHLLDCPTCAALAEPLQQRSLALTAVVFPIALAAWAAAKARGHPVITTAAAGAAVAAVIVGTQVVTPVRSAAPHVPQTARRLHRPSPAISSPTTTGRSPIRTAPLGTSTKPTSSLSPLSAFSQSRPPPRVTVNGLRIGGAPVTTTSLRAMTGRPIVATRVRVEQVVTLDGFWVGQSRTVRLWVELVGPRRVMHILKGDLLTFTGIVTANTPNYPSRAGVAANTGSKLLTAEGAHINVETTAIATG